MKKEFVPTVNELIDEHNEFMTPHYATLLGKLSSLAINNEMALEFYDRALAEEAALAESIVNTKLARDTGCLISDSYNEYVDWDDSGYETYLAKDPRSIRLFQSSTVWRNGIMPYFIIGSRSIEPTDKKGYNVELALMPHKLTRIDRSHVLKTWDTEYSAIRDNMARTLETPFTHDELAGMFVPRTKTFKFNSKTTGSVSLNTIETRHHKKRSDISDDDLTHKGLTRLKRAPIGGAKVADMPMKRDPHLNPRLSDAEMIEWGTLSYLTDLAIKFDKVDDFKKLIKG